jgi:hypothetical protein
MLQFLDAGESLQWEPHPSCLIYCGARYAWLCGGFTPIMKTLSLLLVFTLALITGGCGGMLKGKAAAEKSVAEFHTLYNDGKLSEIYAAGHPKFKSVTTSKQFLDLTGAVQRKLGKVKQTTNAGFNLRSYNFTTTVVLTQNTTFEQGTGTEVFTFQMEGDKAVLIGYHINSNDLILK